MEKIDDLSPKLKDRYLLIGKLKAIENIIIFFFLFFFSIYYTSTSNLRHLINEY